MADREKVKKAVRLQAASAQVEAEMSGIATMAKDLSRQLQEIKAQQAALLGASIDQGLPKTTRRKAKKKASPKSKGLLATVGLTIVVLIFLDAANAASVAKKTEKRLCVDYVRGKGNVASMVVEAKDISDVKIEPAPAYGSMELSGYKPHLQYLQDLINASSICRGPVNDLLDEVYKMYTVAANNLAKLEGCVNEYDRVVVSLRNQNHDLKESDLTLKSLDNCYNKLESVRKLWDKTISLGHTAHHHEFGSELPEVVDGGCNIPDAWKEWGHLANGRGGSCAAGLDQRFDFNVRQCSRQVQVNVNAKAANCRVGHRAFGKSSTGKYSLALLDGNNSCSLGCFHYTELYESLTNQPLCLSCITPFLDIFWETTCVDEHIRNQAIEVKSIVIYAHHTVISIKEKEFICQNTYSFSDCCGGKGPTTPSGLVFVDKYRACSMKTVAAVESVYLGAVKIYHLMLDMNYSLALPLLVLLGLVVSPSFSGIALSLWAFYHVASSKALCNVENIVATEAVLDTISTNSGYRAEFKVQRGQCISVGGGLLNVKSIQKRHLYRFEKTVPFKTKLTCAKVDWACWGGSQSQLSSRGNTCSETCTQGVVKTSQEKVPAFSGSGCAAFWEGVLMRQDLCFSIGEFGSQCRFYKHVSYDPVIIIEDDLLYHGDNKKNEVRLVEGESQHGITLQGVMMHHKQVPASMVKRGALQFCSSVGVELQDMCGSLTLLKPNDISPDCYETKLQWSHVRAAYDVEYKPKDAEALMHNSFHLCNNDANVSFHGEEAYYTESSTMALVTVISKGISFVEAHQWCHLDMLQIKPVAGERGFRQSTHVELHNRYAGSCKVQAWLPGCTGLQSSIIIVPASANIGLEFYCHGNASNNLQLNSDGHIRMETIKEVNKNWVPLKTTITNLAMGSMMAADPSKIAGDFTAWVGSFNLASMMSHVIGWFHGNWFRYTLYAFTIIVGYNSVLRGNLTNCIICAIVFYLIGFVKGSDALELNAAVIPATTIKLVRSNLMWFVRYNLLDEYTLANVMDWMILVIMVIIMCAFIEFVTSLCLTMLIKFWVQYSDETRYQDEIVPVGRELRYPLVLRATSLFREKLAFPHKFSQDLFSYSENRNKYLNWRQVACNYRRALLSDGKPVPFSSIYSLILCNRHAPNGICNVEINNGYFAYEWENEKMSLYLSAHVVEIDTQRMRRIYGDVYANTYKKPSGKPLDGVTPKGPVADGRIAGITDDEGLKGLSGWTIITEGEFYVVHASKNGQLASYNKPAKPYAPFEVPFKCRVCKNGGPDGAGPSGSTPSSSTSNRREQIRRCSLGNLTVEEYEDAWGVKYDMHIEGNRRGLACRDVKLWATHVTEAHGTEILPDVSTEGDNYRPYAPVEAYSFVYTSCDKEKVMARQHFIMMSGNILYVIDAPVFRSKSKLMSGTVVYVWYSGLYPTRANLRATSVITIGRKVDDYYYYPIINDSCNMAEFRCRTNNRHLGYVEEVTFNKVRKLNSNNNVIVHFYETTEFKGKTLCRLLSEEHEVIASHEYDNSLKYNPFDWEYHIDGDLLVVKSNQVHGVGSALSSAIDEFDSTADFCKSLISVNREITSPARVPTIVLTTDNEMREHYQFTVYLRKASSDATIYSSGKFVVMGQSVTLVDSIRQLMATLWYTGVELVVVKGDLFELVGNVEISPYDFFVGCETRQTPTLLFVGDREEVALNLRQWLMAELSRSETEALARFDEVVLHPDWLSGSIALAPSVKHSTTQRSLAEWRQHAQFPLEEIDFTGGNWAPMESADVPSLLEISEGDKWIGELQSITSRGSCVGQGNTLLTSRHVTRGCAVKIYRKGYRYKWEKPFLDAEAEDFCVYGGEMPRVASVSKGEILCVVCPFRRIGKFLIVTEEQSNFETRPGAKFNSMRPIDVDPHYTKWVPSPWKGVNGMSGCPIFNSAGQLVSIYGLGKIEHQSMTFDSMSTGSATHVLKVTI